MVLEHGSTDKMANFSHSAPVDSGQKVHKDASHGSVRMQVYASRGIKLDVPDLLQSRGTLFPVLVSNSSFVCHRRCSRRSMYLSPAIGTCSLCKTQFRRIRYMPAGAAKLSVAVRHLPRASARYIEQKRGCARFGQTRRVTTE